MFTRKAMLTQLLRRTSFRPFAFRAVPALAILSSAIVAMATVACDKMPLVAPTGTIITLYPNSTVLAPNGSIEIKAVAIEAGSAPTTGEGTTPGTSTPAQGTPVHNGTLITFTTTLGRLEPQEARTHNGQATVRLFADGRSGVATIRAFSGGASSNELEINVGTAAAATVILSSTPQTLDSAGGTATISARVMDESGTNLSGVPVTFTADNGTLSESLVVTNDSGVATTQLTTSRETVVTASVGAEVTDDITVRLNPRINITITPPTTPPTAGVASTYTIGVGTEANVQNVRVNWGDGNVQNLGAISGSVPVLHTYRTNGAFTISVTATDASGGSETVSTSVDVLPQQPPGVTITASPATTVVNGRVILTATVTGATSTIQRYEWVLGNAGDADPPTAITTGNQVEVRYRATGTKSISVTVTQASGPQGQGIGTVTVQGTVPIR